MGLGRRGTPVRIREAHEADLPNVSRIVLGAFERHVERLYPEEGRRRFRAFAAVDRIAERVAADSIVLVAETRASADRIVGMIETRDGPHVVLFFVDPEFEGRGVGRALMAAAIESRAPRAGPSRWLTVNSSPNAVPIYERLGFAPMGPRTEREGILFVPMRRAFEEREP